jgi:ABC-type Fe3+/spermidine/putrescine transport system ATPase subunit
MAVMSGGRIEQLGTPREVYEEPRTAFVADFLGVSNLMEAVARGDGRVSAEGTELVCAAGDRDAVGEVHITIRPERVRIEPPSSEGENRIPATIERFVYLGATTQVFVTLPNGERLQSLVANAGDVDEYDVGSAVCVHLAPDALRVLAG